jgi:hypothetical protein
MIALLLLLYLLVIRVVAAKKHCSEITCRCHCGGPRCSGTVSQAIGPKVRIGRPRSTVSTIELGAENFFY